MGSGNYYIQTLNSGQASNTLLISVTPFSNDATLASKIYDIKIDITTSISKSTGGNFTITIPKSGSSGSTYLSDFQFVGICEADISPNCTVAPCLIPLLYYCNIDKTMSIITFSIA
jgi:hypothetical protein